MCVAAMASNYAMVVSFYYPERAFTGTSLLLICGCALAVSGMREPKFRSSLALCLSFSMAITLMNVLPDMYNCYAMYNDRESQVAQTAASGETSMTTFGIHSRSRYDGFYQLHDLTNEHNATANVYYYHGMESIVIDRLE